MDAIDLGLDGSTALITGAARGIGKAVAEALGRAGVRLLLCDRLGPELERTRVELTEFATVLDVAELDVRDTARVTAWVGDFSAGIDGVDVLVNNAGGGFWAPFMDVSSNGQAALIAENFTQVADVTRLVVPLMTAGGSIINVTSIEAHRAGPGFGVYSAMKAAVESLTRTLALELSHLQIRVNSVAPDMIQTPGDAELTVDSSAIEAGYEVTPLGRFGAVEDAAGPVLFLASKLSAFVTGTTIHVDGGNGAALGWKRRIDDGRWVL